MYKIQVCCNINNMVVDFSIVTISLWLINRYGCIVKYLANKTHLPNIKNITKIVIYLSNAKHRAKY